MAKKKAAEPTVETPAEEAPAEKMTQRVAVEKALDAGKVLPVNGVPYVQEQFGITLSNQAFSTIKSKINNAGKKAKPKTTKAPVAVPAAARSTAPTKSAVGVASQVEAIKGLVEELGIDQVVSIAKLFAK
jgi:hypothetical protein